MKGQRTVGQYRAIDLFFFAVMLAVSETIVVSAATKWFPGEAYTVSVVPALTAIVMMRWGPWAAIHAVLGGAVLCFHSHAAPRMYAIYCLGNLFSLAALAYVRSLGWERIQQDSVKTVILGLMVWALMQAGRAVLSLIFGAGLAEAAGFFFTDVISLLFTLVILWIARRLDGVMEKQTHYLIRVAEEREKEKGGYR